MSLRRHLQVIAVVNRTPALLYRLRRYFKLRSEPLVLALSRRGLGQADLVLALLRIGTRTARHVVERLIGHPITVAPACLLRYHVNGHAPRVARQPVITHVVPKCPARKSKLATYFAEFKVGRTLSQLAARGVTRRVLRTAERRGWIQLAH